MRSRCSGRLMCVGRAQLHRSASPCRSPKTLPHFPPQGWSWSLFGIGVAAFLSYFVAIGGVFACRARGLLAPLECRGARKPHKALRAAWDAQFGIAAASSVSEEEDSLQRVLVNPLRVAGRAFFVGGGV